MKETYTGSYFILGIIGIIILILGLISILNNGLSKYGIEIIIWIFVLSVDINCWIDFKRGMDKKQLERVKKK